MLRESLKVILDIQELDIKMIRLMRLKKDRIDELERIRSLRNDLSHQVVVKEGEIIDLKKQSRLCEIEGSEIKTRIQKLEGQQSSVKKVEEFNALTQEISGLEKEKNQKEQRLSDIYDKLAQEEDLLKSLRVTFEATKQNGEQLEVDIHSSIEAINKEGSQLKKERDKLVEDVDTEIFKVYEKLLKNKRDRVFVPIQNRCCSGCHILVTAQHENVVRKGEKLVFCEHCSRMHFWQDNIQEGAIQEEGVPTRRRRRASIKAS